MSSDHYLRLLSRHLEAENAHLLPETLATLSADCVFDDMALRRLFEAHLGAASYYRMWWDAFSVAVSPEELHLSGDVAMAETTWRGTHVGPFLGLAPTGRSIEVPVILVVEFRDGLMAGEASTGIVARSPPSSVPESRSSHAPPLD